MPIPISNFHDIYGKFIMRFIFGEVEMWKCFFVYRQTPATIFGKVTTAHKLGKRQKSPNEFEQT